MEIRTHVLADKSLLGTPLRLVDDSEALLELTASSKMAVDNHGLVHGGFTFGLADLAAMLAVNHANVVLTEAHTKLLAPVIVGDRLYAHAKVVEKSGRRRRVSVEVKVEDKLVLQGDLLCAILQRHVLDREGSA